MSSKPHSEHVKAVRDGLRAIRDLAWLSYDGDPWYAENAGVDVESVRYLQGEADAALMRLEEQLETLRNGLAIIASKTYPVTYVGLNEYGVEVYGSYDDASNFAREILDRVSNPASEPKP